MILGIDISHWQDRADFPLLKEAGIEFAICKASQGDYSVDDRFEQHVKGAKAAGMIVGAYHWADPLSEDGKQAKSFLSRMANLPIDFAMIDVEQYWSDWAEFRAKKITKFISDNRITENAVNLLDIVSNFYPVVFYSRLTFIKEHAASLLGWVDQWPMCWAQYPYKAGRVSVSWAEFTANHLPSKTSPTLTGTGLKNWHFWQFTGDKFMLPGVYDSKGNLSPLDVNYWNGTREELVKFCGGETVSEETKVVEEKLKLRVSVPVLNIREGPGIHYKDIGDLHGNDIVEALDVAGSEAWVEIAPGKWACAQFGETKYLVKEPE